jgi:hypothetical protein
MMTYVFTRLERRYVLHRGTNFTTADRGLPVTVPALLRCTTITRLRAALLPFLIVCCWAIVDLPHFAVSGMVFGELFILF